MRRFTTLLTLLLATAVVATGACASAGTSAEGGARAARGGSSSNLLTAADIATAPQRNLRDVIQALRPRWLQNTAAGSISAGGANGPILVSVNGRLNGGLDELSTIDKAAVDRMVYYTLSEAQGRYGTAVRGPVIDVRLKVGG